MVVEEANRRALRAAQDDLSRGGAGVAVERDVHELVDGEFLESRGSKEPALADTNHPALAVDGDAYPARGKAEDERQQRGDGCEPLELRLPRLEPADREAEALDLPPGRTAVEESP
jgi:hypothetical protein